LTEFAFTVRDQKDQRTSGTIEAADRETAMKMLSEKNLVVTSLTQVHRRKTGILNFLGLGLPRLKGEELLLFTQEMAAMLDSGIPLKKATDIMIADAESPVMRQILIDISSGVSSGTQLSEVLQRYDSVFSKLYVSMVAAGEAGGNLPLILQRLANYIENSETLKQKVKSALYYPVMVVCFAFVMVTFIFIFGIPRLQGIYEGFGSELPLPTQMFLDFTKFLMSAWPFILAILIAAGIFLGRFLRTRSGQLTLDNLKLNLVLIGPLLRKLSISRFSRTLSTLYSSGVPILKSMELVAGSMGNKVMEEVVLKAVKSLREGELIANPLRRSNIFTQMSISMIAAGEETGSLETMLDKLADFYESQVDISLKAMTGLLEPIIMIVVGIIIAFVVVVLALPFMTLSTLLNK
jgi:type IV pilus assembly protein PilC